MALTPQLVATAATSTETSDYFKRPFGVRSAFITFDHTVGATVDLTVSLQAMVGNGDWIEWITDDTAITDPGSCMLLLSPLPQAGISSSGVNLAFVAPLPEIMRLVVTHGNGTASTYTVTVGFF